MKAYFAFETACVWGKKSTAAKLPQIFQLKSRTLKRFLLKYLCSMRIDLLIVGLYWNFVLFEVIWFGLSEPYATHFTVTSILRVDSEV